MWRFTLINSAGVETVVENPQGWENVSASIDRDPDWHGVFFDYVANNLTFYGTGAQLLKDEYEVNGFSGVMGLRVEYQCQTPGVYEIFYEGSITFSSYSDTCGDECTVTVGVEDADDVMLFKNNYQQSIDLNRAIAFDGVTLLQDYDRLNVDLLIPSRGIPQRSASSNSELQAIDFVSPDPAIGAYPGWSSIASGGSTGTEQGAAMPIFNTADTTEIADTNINSAPYYDTNAGRFNDGNNSTGSPAFINIAKSTLKCFPNSLRLVTRVKGRFIDNTIASRVVNLTLNVRVGPNPADTDLAYSQTMVDYEINAISKTTEFDINADIGLNIQYGSNVYVYIIVTYFKSSSAALIQERLEFDEECNITFSGISYCDPGDSRVYYVNEAVSRAVEAITNDRIRFYSEMFGRVDSQPYAMNDTGCAGLMAITSGLMLRRRNLTDTTQPGFFVTMEQLFKGLNGIWHIGLTIEPDTNRVGYNRLRFEDYRFFYKPEVGIIFNMPVDNKITRTAETDRMYNRMKVGYNKWTAGQYSGLDEYMTKRTYRINVSAESKELDATTDFICSTYTIEIIRRLDQTTQDYQYDNDIIAFCLGDKTPTQDYRITMLNEEGYSITNILDPGSCYNGRVSPARNAMRWFNWIIQGIRTLGNNSQLIFSSGEGNYVASYGLNICNIEGQPLSEMENIQITDFQEISEGTPLLFPERIEFQHPLNWNLFTRIRKETDLRYKAVMVRCNNVDTYGWIKTIDYKPNEGIADIVLWPKNNKAVQLPQPPVCNAAIQEGSITITGFDYNTKKATVDFVESIPGATFWSYIITKGTVPAESEGFNGVTTVHPFEVTGLEPGTWSVFLVPYCDENRPGPSYASGTFELPAPPCSIIIYAKLTRSPAGRNHVRLYIDIQGTNRPAFASFNWGYCYYRYGAGQRCHSFPGADPATPTNLVTFGPNTPEHTEWDSVLNTVSEPEGYIQKIVIFGLSGITSAQITKNTEPEFTGWDIEFIT